MPTVHRGPLPNGAKLLLDNVTFEESCEQTFAYLLGRTAIVKSSADFAAARSMKLDAITVDGDQGQRDGVLKGGHYRQNECLLSQYRVYRETQENSLNALADLDEVNSQLAEKSSAKEKVMADIQKLEAKIDLAESNLAKAKRERDSQVYKVICLVLPKNFPRYVPRPNFWRPRATRPLLPMTLSVPWPRLRPTSNRWKIQPPPSPCCALCKRWRS